MQSHRTLVCRNLFHRQSSRARSWLYPTLGHTLTPGWVPPQSTQGLTFARDGCQQPLHVLVHAEAQEGPESAQCPPCSSLGNTGPWGSPIYLPQSSPRILGSQVPRLSIPTLVARPRWLRISWARDGAGSVPFMAKMTGCREQRPDCGCGPGPAQLGCRLLAIPRGTQKGARTCWAALGARLEPSRDQGWHWPCPLRGARLF